MKYIYPLIILFIHTQAVAQQNDFSSEILSLDSLVNVPSSDSTRQKINTTIQNISNIDDSLSIEYSFSDSLLQKNPVNKGAKKFKATQQKIVTADDSIRRKIQNIIPDSLKNIVPNGAAGLPEAEISELDIPTINSLNVTEDLKEIDGLKEIKEIQKLRDFEAVPDLNEISSGTEQVNEIKSNVPKTENLTETVEGKAKNLKGIKALDDEKSALESGVPDLKNLNDHEHYKEALANKAKEKAVDHFAGHTDKLKEAQSKLAEVKKKFPEGVSSIKDLPKRKTNPLKGKSFKERLALGLTVQIHPDKIPNVDLSPFVAYKISPRLSFGLGGNYRLVSKPKFKGLTTEGAVYGYRGFTELMVHKGFFLHAEYEMLKTLVRDSIHFGAYEKILEKKWIDGLLLGIGREYKIGGLVKGNMQVLYNFLNQPNSPYNEKLMVRFGFSFQLKDKVNKPDLAPEVERVKKKGKRSLRKLKDENISGSLK